MVIADYKKAMLNKDYKALSECFAKKCSLFDYCPAGAGKEDFFIYGREAIDMFYHNQFILCGLSILDPQIVNERTLNFYGNYGGVIIHAVATIESYDPDSGLISEMVIRPA